MQRGWVARILVAALALLLPAGAAAQELALVNPALHQYEGGPPVSAGFEFLPGDTVFLSFRITGFRTEEKNDEDHLRLRYEIEAFDPTGIPLRRGAGGAIAAELTPQDRKNQWTPQVLYEVLVPTAAPSGTYRLAVRVEDEFSKTAVAEEITYAVRGRNVPPSDTLVVRNFRFYRTQTAPEPLPVPAYRPGDSLWARFDITGYQLGEENRLHINYGLSVERASGAVAFTQEVAAVEERSSFYPERHIMGGFSLNLTPDLSPGDYTLVVTVRDLLGDQTYETKQVFHVE
jgi:hypothetical protein